jgi:hypothetical protein
MFSLVPCVRRDGSVHFFRESEVGCDCNLLDNCQSCGTLCATRVMTR